MMKNVRLLIMAFMLLSITFSSTDKAIAQALSPSGTSQQVRRNVTSLNWYDFQGGEYVDGGIFWGTETATTRKYTVQGTYPLVVVSANYTNDTVTLLKTNYSAGQIIRIITTAALNDTLTITHDGNLNGATTAALVSPATSASYKKSAIYFDGTNYWFLQ